MGRKRLAKFALVGVGLAAAFAAGHFLRPQVPQPQPEALPTEPPVVAKAEPPSEAPKPQPAVVALPAVGVSAPPTPPPVVPIPPPNLEFPPLPPVPPTSVSPLPVGPPTLGALPPVATEEKKPAPPPEPEITEPVASVHRFEGKYLGGDARHAFVYVEIGGDAEVQYRPLTNAIPNADEIAKNEAKSTAVPIGKATYHSGRAFVTTPRELLVINTDCRTEWRFALPGKPDNGETLLDVVGFRDGKVSIASNQTAADGKKSLGRVYVLDAATGGAVSLATVADGFDPKATLIPAGDSQLISVGTSQATVHSLSGGPSVAVKSLLFPVTHAVPFSAGVCVSAHIVGTISGSEFLGIWGASGTAPTRQDRENSRLFFAPCKSREDKLFLVAAERGKYGDSRENRSKWILHVEKAITTQPLLRGASVYFVAGDVLYRASAETGTVCWKLTLPLAATDTLTDLTFADGELRASGPGVLVRVSDRQ